MDVILCSCWEVDAGEEEAVEGGVQKHLVLGHETTGIALMSSLLAGGMGMWER